MLQDFGLVEKGQQVGGGSSEAYTPVLDISTDLIEGFGRL
jgi:hypothetical protein